VALNCAVRAFTANSAQRAACIRHSLGLPGICRLPAAARRERDSSLSHRRLIGRSRRSPMVRLVSPVSESKVSRRSEGFVTLGAFGVETVIDASAKIAKGQVLAGLLDGVDPAACMLVCTCESSDWKFTTSDCPRKQARNLNDQCGARICRKFCDAGSNPRSGSCRGHRHAPAPRRQAASAETLEDPSGVSP
jgi:hypothetical protein